MLPRSFPGILDGDPGAPPGGKRDDADLDYEILDKAGECRHPQASAASTPPRLLAKLQGHT